MADYTKAVKRHLSQNGCKFHRRGKGDHDIWHSSINNCTFPVDNQITSRYLANKILSQAGLSKKF